MGNALAGQVGTARRNRKHVASGYACSESVYALPTGSQNRKCPLSESAHSRRFRDVRVMSALPSIATVVLQRIVVGTSLPLAALPQRGCYWG